jgi:SAM-dependent methyltransferase
MLNLPRRGIRQNIADLLYYLTCSLFDVRYGTDTVSSARLENLKIDSVNKERGKTYQPAHAHGLKALFRELRIPRGKVLVDLGCGKGLALMIASGFGFRELRGVEFSPELYGIAVKNCAIYREKTGANAKFIIYKSDVVDYKINDDEGVYFMFNPFDDCVLGQVLQNICSSLLRRKRKIWIIYQNPRYGNVIEQSGKFIKLREFVSWRTKFSIFVSADTDSWETQCLAAT